MLESKQEMLYVFPGQGSQYLGIGSHIYEEYAAARQVYMQASEVLGYDIADLSFNDPEHKLNLTRYTQPVLLTHSIACLEVFNELTDNRLKPTMTAGHSLGEYTALVAAEMVSFESALKLVQQRGELMGEYGEGGMSAFPMDRNSLRPIAVRRRCAVAGINLPDQTVVGGRISDLDLLEQDVKEQFPRKRAFRLKTEGAFHTYFMVKPAQLFQAALEKVDFAPSQIKVLSNYTGGYHEPDPVDIRARLFFQFFNPVLWHANLLTAFGDDVKTIIEFGGGISSPREPAAIRPNLEGMIKKAMKTAGHEAQYLSAINIETLVNSAEFAQS